MVIVISGSPKVVNTTVESQQYDPSVSPLSDGGYVVSWISKTDSTTDDWFHKGDIHAQRFSATGAPVGEEVVLEGGDARWDDQPKVLGLKDGGYAVAWRNGAGGSSEITVRLRLFDADGTPRGDAVPFGNGYDNIGLAQLGSGDIVATWTSYTGSATKGVRFQMFGPDGSMGGASDLVSQGEFTPGVYGGPGSNWSEVAALKGGGFVVAFQYDNFSLSADPDGSHAVYARVYDADGKPVGDEFQVNTTKDGADDSPKVAALADGGFVVTWHAGSDGGERGVRAQVFEADGAPRGGEFIVNTTTALDQHGQDIVALADGGFLVVWTSTDQGIMGQRFGADGTRIGPETVMFAQSASAPGVAEAHIAQLKDGTLVLVSSDGGSDLSGDIYAAHFGEGDGTILGTPGRDRLKGDDLDNRIDGLGGADKIFGYGGSDTLLGSGGNDIIYGGGGNDTLKGGTGNDRLWGEAGRDKLVGNGGDDILYGGTGNDSLSGLAGNDILMGQSGDDLLNGGKHADQLFGGDGDDRLDGGNGKDVIHGDEGADTFVFGKGRDVVRDFENDIDTVELNHKLWSGSLTVAEVVDSFGSIVKGNAVLDFGDGNKLVLIDVTDLASLHDDVTIA